MDFSNCYSAFDQCSCWRLGDNILTSLKQVSSLLGLLGYMPGGYKPTTCWDSVRWLTQKCNFSEVWTLTPNHPFFLKSTLIILISLMLRSKRCVLHHSTSLFTSCLHADVCPPLTRPTIVLSSTYFMVWLDVGLVKHSNVRSVNERGLRQQAWGFLYSVWF